jgi:hypothetical protein
VCLPPETLGGSERRARRTTKYKNAYPEHHSYTSSTQTTYLNHYLPYQLLIMPQPQWSPTAILQLCNDRRCVGYAPSTRQKCTIKIRKDNVNRCNSIVADMAWQAPDPVLLAPKLRELAGCGLCVRYHQYQIGKMVEKWSARIRAAFPAPISRVGRGGTARRSAGPEELTPAQRDRAEIEALQATIAAAEEEVRTARRRLNLLQNASRASSVSRVSTSTLNVPTVSSTSHSSSPTRSRTVSPTPPHAVPTPAPARGSSHTVPTPRCRRTHVRRISIDEECGICYEEMMSEGDSTLVWCKCGCGKSVHTECFEEWRKTCVGARTAAKCVNCRREWEDRCGC